MRLPALIASIALVASAEAATLNVPASYSTVEAAIAAAQPGDTVSIGAGVYNENVTTDRAGTSGARIIIDGNNVATIRQFSFNHAYITLQNVRVEGSLAAFGNHISINRGAHFAIVDHVTVDANSSEDRRGIVWQNPTVGTEPFGTDAASDCIIRNSTIREISGTMYIMLHGSRNVIEDNICEDGNDADFFNAFGEDHIIRRNIFRDIVDDPTVVNHPDFFQTYGTDGWGLKNVLIERNLVANMTASGSQLVQLESSMISGSGNIVLQNNVFRNIVGGAGISVPGVAFYNNVLYLCASGSRVDPAGTVTSPFTWSSRSYFVNASNTVHPSNQLYSSMSFPIASGSIINGAFYKVVCASGQSVTYDGVAYTNGQNFWGTATTTFTKSDAANQVWRGYISSANNGKAKGNVFLDCGDGTSGRGWYSYEKTPFAGVPTTLTGIEADYNYVGSATFQAKAAGTDVISGAGYNAQKFYELHGKNGGDPGFTSIGSYDFSLISSSILIDAGVAVTGVDDDYIGAARPAGTAPDIGAYEYTAVEYDYHVATDGNDSNNGSLASPFLTIAKAVSVAVAGETIYVEAGTYPERITTARAGTAGNPITLLGDPSGVTMRGININHAYFTFDRFRVTGYSAASTTTGHISIGSGGDNAIVRNCTITGLRHIKLADISFTGGTNVISSPTGGFSGIGITAGDTIAVEKGDSSVSLNAANYKTHTVTSATNTEITVASNLVTEGPKNVYITASYQYGLYAAAGATGVLVNGNVFDDLNYDSLAFFGSSSQITSNRFTKCNGWDCMHYGGTGNTFSGNHINSYTQVVYQISPDVFENWTPEPYSNIVFEGNFIERFAGVFQAQKGQGTMSGLVIRENVIANCGWMSITHPGTTIENNTFYAVARDDDPTYSQEDYVIRVREDLGATGVVVRNNVFFDCGDIGNSQTQADVGWYLVNGASTFSATGNFASGPPLGYGAKTGWTESSSLNGGNPLFANAANLIGADSLIFTVDDGLVPQTGSPLIDAGEGGADIGAYSVGAPSTPSGVTIEVQSTTATTITTQ